MPSNSSEAKRSGIRPAVTNRTSVRPGWRGDATLIHPGIEGAASASTPPAATPITSVATARSPSIPDASSQSPSRRARAMICVAISLVPKSTMPSAAFGMNNRAITICPKPASPNAAMSTGARISDTPLTAA